MNVIPHVETVNIGPREFWFDYNHYQILGPLQDGFTNEQRCRVVVISETNYI